MSASSMPMEVGLPKRTMTDSPGNGGRRRAKCLSPIIGPRITAWSSSRSSLRRTFGGLMEKFPDLYALILSTPQGDPVEVPGARLRAMRDDGDLTLYPATYRLVFDHDRQQ